MKDVTISWADVAGELWPGDPGYRRQVSPWILQQAETATRGARAEDRGELIENWIDALESDINCRLPDGTYLDIGTCQQAGDLSRAVDDDTLAEILMMAAHEADWLMLLSGDEGREDL